MNQDEESTIIARHWRGWTKAEDADSYEDFQTKKLLPELRAIEGYRGGYLLRSNSADETEFVVINFFNSLDAVKRFAGPNYTVATFEPEARRLLSRKEDFATHYAVRACTV
jgi:heme-degrading monooxygenase HmoA